MCTELYIASYLPDIYTYIYIYIYTYIYIYINIYTYILYLCPCCDGIELVYSFLWTLSTSASNQIWKWKLMNNYYTQICLTNIFSWCLFLYQKVLYENSFLYEKFYTKWYWTHKLKTEFQQCNFSYTKALVSQCKIM